MVNTVSVRKWRIVSVILVILVIIVFFTWISFQWEQSTRQSERHDLTYSIELSVNTTIENVSLLLPVPELNKTPLLADALVNRTGYGVPADWNLSIVRVEGIPMLSIIAARMIPEYHGYPLPIEPGKTPNQTPVPSATEYSSETPVLVPVLCAVMESRPMSIDTRNPAGHEPVFMPGEQFIPVTGTSPAYQGAGFSHRVPIYIQYTSDRPATLSIRISIEGSNSIWRGGWLGNRYSDAVSLTLDNGTQGWIEGEGTLITGEDVYY